MEHLGHSSGEPRRITVALIYANECDGVSMPFLPRRTGDFEHSPDRHVGARIPRQVQRDGVEQPSPSSYLGEHPNLAVGSTTRHRMQLGADLVPERTRRAIPVVTDAEAGRCRPGCRPQWMATAQVTRGIRVKPHVAHRIPELVDLWRQAAMVDVAVAGGRNAGHHRSVAFHATPSARRPGGRK